ncbi:type B 50S ribosomal protein L31 [Candidatus Peribacteria bacterium]|nr:type B 50S ribosomal protein L31 [Candidatus Peribacteria bacterium]
MKAAIHPTLRPVIFRDARAGKDFVIYSTLETDEKDTHNGQECSVYRVEVSSESHPFYTGTQTLVTTSGQIDKFKARMAKAKNLQS